MAQPIRSSSGRTVVVALLLAIPAIVSVVAFLVDSYGAGPSVSLPWPIPELILIGGLGGGALSILAAPALYVLTLRKRHSCPVLVRGLLYVLCVVATAPIVGYLLFAWGWSDMS